MSKRKRPADDNPGPVPVNFTDEELTYRDGEFLCPGQDDRGGSVRVSFRCPPVMERQLEVVRDNHRFPYKTTSDIIRHAVYRHVQWLQRMEPDMPRHILAGLDAVMEVCRDAVMRGQIEETFQQMNKLIERNLADGNKPEALRLMTVSKQKITMMPDSMWKKKWMDNFNRLYSHHLMPSSDEQTGSGAAKIVPFPQEE